MLVFVCKHTWKKINCEKVNIKKWDFGLSNNMNPFIINLSDADINEKINNGNTTSILNQIKLQIIFYKIQSWTTYFRIVGFQFQHFKETKYVDLAVTSFYLKDLT